MLGGIEETSASFEARSAPQSYPTAGGVQQWASLPRTSVELTRSASSRRMAGFCAQRKFCLFKSSRKHYRRTIVQLPQQRVRLGDLRQLWCGREAFEGRQERGVGLGGTADRFVKLG